MKNKNRKKILMAGLLSVLLLMSIAFTAFQTNLTINGSSNINSNWCVGFDSTKTNTYVATVGITGATAPTGQMAYSGNTCQTSYKTTATLTSKFTQPGDKVVYTLTIANKSSASAQIDSITVDNQSVTSDTTITKGNIKYKVEMPLSTTLATNGETIMRVTAEFQNDTNIGNYTTSESASIDVRINTSEGSGGFTPINSFTGTIYRNNTNDSENGDAIADTTIYEWCMVGTFQGQNVNSCDDDGGSFNSSSACEAELANGIAGGYISEGDMSCESQATGTKQAINIGNYTTNPSSLNTNAYLKHDVVDNIITATYACLKKSGTEYCFKSDDNAFYNSNITTVQTAFPETNACHTEGNLFACSVNNNQANISSAGGVCVYDGTIGCNAGGTSSCQTGVGAACSGN